MDYAHKLLSEFKPNAINDMSLVNASLRPSGKSYRNRLIGREFNKNPSEQIDELLENNNGFLVFQEDTIKFLTDICGFSGSLADTTRRCVDENTLVTMGNGNVKKIKNIKVGEKVISVNKQGVSESKVVKNVFENGVKEVFKLTTIHGKELIATNDHKVYTQDGFKCIKDLNTNDSIMSLKNINCDKDNLRPNKRLSSQEMFLIGMLIGDGTIYEVSKNGEYYNKKPSFTNSEIVLIEKFKECIESRIRTDGKSVNCEFSIIEQNGVDVDKIYNIRIKTKTANDSLVRLLDKYELRCHSSNKKIHDRLMSYPKGEKLQGLLGGLFSTDGGCYDLYIDYSTTSQILAQQIQYLLLKFGIYSYISKKWVGEYNYYSYRVYISQKDSMLSFKDAILPFVIGAKNKKFNDVINNIINNKKAFNYLLPNKCKQEIRDNMIIYKKSFNDIGLSLGYKENSFNIHSTEFGISDIKAREVLKEVCIPYTYSLLMSEYIPLRVKSIEYMGITNVYDIEVEDNHNYIANGLVVHNCIGKKDLEGLKEQLPKILEGYCNKSKKERNEAEQEANEFIQIISDSSEYQFGYNHSTGYSMLGYMSARLRYYYPLEFTTAYLNRAENDEDIEYGTKLAEEKGFKIEMPKFGLSKAKYFYNKDLNTIYKGVSSIKGLGESDGDSLYKLSKNNKYNSFLSLYKDIKLKTSINDGKIQVLIKLNYFSEFGKSKKLLTIVEKQNILDKKQFNKEKIHELGISEELLRKYSKKETAKLFKDVDTEKLIQEIVKLIPDEDISLKDKIGSEIEYLGYPCTTIKNTNKNIYYILELKIFKNKKSITYYPVVYNIRDGSKKQFKIKDYVLFSENPFKEGNIIKIVTEHREPKKTKNEDGKWIQSKTDFNNIIDCWEVY